MALAVMGGLVVLYGWNSFFLAPKAKATADVKKELTAARKQEDELRQNLAELKKLANDTQAREAELARLGRLIPANQDIAGAILILNDTAHQAQVAWSSFVPSPKPGTGGAIDISVKVAGTFGQIFDYLKRLEQLDRLVVVDSLQLSGSPNTAGAPVINADIAARMFSVGSATPATTKSGSTKDSDPTKLAKAGN
jgi:Tfp pilus assembly protein PilO